MSAVDKFGRMIILYSTYGAYSLAKYIGKVYSNNGLHTSFSNAAVLVPVVTGIRGSSQL